MQNYGMVALWLLNYFTDYIQQQLFSTELMQNFVGCFNSFITPNSGQYLLLYPNYFTPQQVYYPINSSFQIPIQKEEQIYSTLAPSFTAKFVQNEEQALKKTCYPVKIADKQPKTRKSISQKEEDQQSFNIKITKNEPSVTYKKKNTQSNIVNQTFSFLNSDRSKKLAFSYFKDQKKVQEFYRLMARVKQANKKYINRNYLQRLLNFQSNSQFQRAFIKAKISLINREDVRDILRILTFNFLREQINLTLITSCKIYKETLSEHFWRKRQIKSFLFGKKIN